MKLSRNDAAENRLRRSEMLTRFYRRRRELLNSRFGASDNREVRRRLDDWLKEGRIWIMRAHDD